MMFTNLRIIWYSLADIKINLTIGYDNILSSDVKSAVFKVKHSNRPKEENYMNVRIMVYYSSIYKYGNFDADDLAYELEKALRKSTGMPLILNYDTTNTNTSFEW